MFSYYLSFVDIYNIFLVIMFILFLNDWRRKTRCLLFLEWFLCIYNFYTSYSRIAHSDHTKYVKAVLKACLYFEFQILLRSFRLISFPFISLGYYASPLSNFSLTNFPTQHFQSKCLFVFNLWDLSSAVIYFRQRSI